MVKHPLNPVLKDANLPEDFGPEPLRRQEGDYAPPLEQFTEKSMGKGDPDSSELDKA
jgi:hypothetical protein